jgi:ABC-2 type transport system ATP-binding protein
MNIIEIENVTHRYWRTEALRNLTLNVPAGSVFALLGANGAGKTTAIKMIMNLLRPSAGVVRVLGQDSARLGEQELARIGYVSENQQLPLWMTVRQLLDYCRPFYPTWDAALETKLLAQFDLPVDRKLKQLSRGMLMKVALLSSLAYRPKLLVLDEPFSGLDPLVRDEFIQGLLEAAELGDWTVFVSSHDIEEVERLADHVALLENGSLKFTETTESLLGRFRRIEVELNQPAGSVRPLPAWLGWRCENGRATFVDPAYDGVATEEACRRLFPSGSVQAHPMTLREIFIALARANRGEARGTAA